MWIALCAPTSKGISASPTFVCGLLTLQETAWASSKVNELPLSLVTWNELVKATISTSLIAIPWCGYT